jgi:hypothetical protein
MTVSAGVFWHECGTTLVDPLLTARLSEHQVMINGSALHPPSPLRVRIAVAQDRAVSWMTKGTVGPAVILP